MFIKGSSGCYWLLLNIVFLLQGLILSCHKQNCFKKYFSKKKLAAPSVVSPSRRDQVGRIRSRQYTEEREYSRYPIHNYPVSKSDYYYPEASIISRITSIREENAKRRNKLSTKQGFGSSKNLTKPYKKVIQCTKKIDGRCLNNTSHVKRNDTSKFPANRGKLPNRQSPLHNPRPVEMKSLNNFSRIYQQAHEGNCETLKRCTKLRNVIKTNNKNNTVKFTEEKDNIVNKSNKINESLLLFKNQSRFHMKEYEKNKEALSTHPVKAQPQLPKKRKDSNSFNGTSKTTQLHPIAILARLISDMDSDTEVVTNVIKALGIKDLLDDDKNTQQNIFFERAYKKDSRAPPTLLKTPKQIHSETVLSPNKAQTKKLISLPNVLQHTRVHSKYKNLLNRNFHNKIVSD